MTISPGTLVKTPESEGTVEKTVWTPDYIPEPVWLVALVVPGQFRSYRESSLSVIGALKVAKPLKSSSSILSDLVGTRWKHIKNGKIFKYTSLSLDGVVRLDQEGVRGFFYNCKQANLEKCYERVE